MRYIDECDMEDEAPLWYHHIVPDSVVKLCFWPEWRALIRAACKGDTEGESYLCTYHPSEQTDVDLTLKRRPP